MRSLLRGLFSEYYDLYEAADGEEGLREALRVIPDVILSDVMMPKMDGLELCDRIKRNESTSHIPVVLLSAKASSEDMSAGLRTWADAYCPKPFDNQVLVELIASTLRNRARLAEIYMRMGAFNKDRVKEGDESQDMCLSNVDVLFMQRVEEFVCSRMHDSEFMVSDVCDHMGLTRVVLNKKLKSLTGVTAVSLIRTCRLRRAAELLRTSRYNVSDVTFDVGFNDLRHFRECFRKEFGMLPQEYKEAHAETKVDDSQRES